MSYKAVHPYSLVSKAYQVIHCMYFVSHIKELALCKLKSG